MARAHSYQEVPDRVSDPKPGEWQALRGELVALLDQVEGRYARVESDEPAMDGLSQRVRNLRDQVLGPEPVDRRREALRTVKRAVDRFSFRDEVEQIEDDQDSLANAIAEIRGRQISGTAAALGHRVVDTPEFRELSGLVGGLSGRLETLEGELKSQRTSNGSVNEVASQVEQLTHVVELLAGAVGETGQVKRLESQIAALAALVEKGPKVGLNAINKRLDDLSTTVGKLAELQAQQMEREIVREDRLAAAPASAGAALAPAMQAIEAGVRNVYDRIDSIEKNVALSSGDFERLTAEMAAFTKAMKNRETPPGALVDKVDALASRIGELQAANGDVAGLKQDVLALRQAVMTGMAPRFDRIESQIEALSERMTPASDTAQVEDQLRLLIKRMDETGAQLTGLTKLYGTRQDAAEIEAVATLVAERTSEAVTRKAPAPVAMFGADSLKSIEDRLSTLIKSAGKTPDYETLADLVAERTSQAVAKSAAAPAASDLGNEGMRALEQRMTALFNTAGQDTAERLMRLEAALSNRAAQAAASAAPQAPSSPPRPSVKPGDMPGSSNGERLEAMLAALGSPLAESDAMPTNPGDDAPLIDPGFRDASPVRSALAAKANAAPRPASAPLVAAEPASVSKPAAAARPAAAKADGPAMASRPAFDPASVERPPRPQSSLSPAPTDAFAAAAPAVSQAEAQIIHNSTSTFVAAARRAQRARAEAAVPDAAGNSVISRALSRFMPDKPAAGAGDQPSAMAQSEKPARSAKPVKVDPDVAGPVAAASDADQAKPGFIIRHRRPLLLAATLVVVSMLALNLVLQRMAPAPSQQLAGETTQPPAAPVTAPTGSGDVSLVRPEPRVIDMIDSTATGSINPDVSSFTRSTMPATPMPPTLLAGTGARPAVSAPAALSGEPLVTGSIGDQPESVETFDLPPEAIGPLELRQAAANGDARAQFEVAAIFAEGRAVDQDFAEAAKWYERSAAQGFVPAQYRLGNVYETGTGVEVDLTVAKLWYQRAAEAANRMAMHNLAALYAGGQMGEQAFESAAEWFEQAASRGMTDSQFNLGMLYARGLGVPQDFEQSYKWFALAALGGDADAGKARDDIAKSLSADAVSRISAEVAAWKMTPIDLAANFAPIGTWSDKFVTGEPITSREVIAKVQLALGKLGFDVGTPDGVVGPKTTQAIEAFESATGMSQTGVINPRLLAVLGSQPV